MTFFGKGATNVYLHKTWNEELRLFEAGTLDGVPVVFGYRAAGEVVESRADASRRPACLRQLAAHRVLRHAARARARPAASDDLTWDDGVDIGQMGPLRQRGHVRRARARRAPVVVFGAGPVGLISAQVARADGAERVYVVDRIPERLASRSRWDSSRSRRRASTSQRP